MLRMMLGLMLGVFMSTAVMAETRYQCTFTKDGWQEADWLSVRRPDLNIEDAQWIQGVDYIQNSNPRYMSMLYKQPMTNDVVIRCTMSFQDRMAPLIVLANTVSTNQSGSLEYTDMFEVVLYDQGINIWRLKWLSDANNNSRTTKKYHCRKTAFWKFPLIKEEKYTLVVTKKGKQLKVQVNDRTFGYIEDDLNDTYSVGITGCEGINRFYDFSITNL